MVIPSYPDPEFIGPDFGPLQSVVEFGERGVATVRPLTDDERAEDEAYRADRHARLATRRQSRREKPAS